MIIDLPSTTTGEVSKRLVRMRADVGAMALGRVLTLVIVVDDEHVDEAIEVANTASRQHPCRIVVVAGGNKRGRARLDAQIRVGGDAGASEVVVMRLYGRLSAQGRSVTLPLVLPDSPIVAWWPRTAPADVANDPIGSLAQRRITDASQARNVRTELSKRAETYVDGDTDLAWTRVTLWRGLLAAALDQAPFSPATEATVVGAGDSPSAQLLAAWLAHSLRCPVRLARSVQGSGIVSVRLARSVGTIDLVRPEGDTATLIQDGQPDRKIALPHRSDAECLADELRRLDPDEVYEDALVRGMPIVRRTRSTTASEAVAAGVAPSTDHARKVADRLERESSVRGSSVMVEARTPPTDADDATVHGAAARKLEEKRDG